MMPFTVDDWIEHGLWLSRAVCLGSLLLAGSGVTGAYAIIAFFVSFIVMAVLSLKKGARANPPPRSHD